MLRWSALLGAGALVVHEIQYRVSFGAEAGEALAAHGHAYLSWALALVSVLATLAVLRLLGEVRAAHGSGPADARRAPATLARRWASASAALASTYLLQEGLEGVLATGHPGLLHAVASHHGWLGVLLAFGLGLVVACLARGAEAIVERVARRRPGAPHRRGEQEPAPAMALPRPEPRCRRPSPRRACPAGALPVVS